MPATPVAGAHLSASTKALRPSRLVASLCLGTVALALAWPHAPILWSVSAICLAAILAFLIPPSTAPRSGAPAWSCLFVLWYLAAILGSSGFDRLADFAPMLFGLVVYLVYLRVSGTRADGLTGLGLLGMASMVSLSVLLTARGGLDPSGMVDALNVPVLIVPNDIGIAVLALVLARLLIREPGLDLMIILVSGLVAAAAVVLESRLALIMIASLLAFEFRRHQRRVAPLLLFLALPALALVFSDTGLLTKSLAGLQARLELWLEAVRQIAVRPLLGHGPFSFQVAGLATDPRPMSWPHNLILETGVGVGVVGTLVWLAGLWAHFRPWITPARLPVLVPFTLYVLLEASWMRIGFVFCWLLFLAHVAADLNKERSDETKN